MTHGTLTLERAYQLRTEAVLAREEALRRGNEAWVHAHAKRVRWLGEWISRREKMDQLAASAHATEAAS